jgi:hypothetical protein
VAEGVEPLRLPLRRDEEHRVRKPKIGFRRNIDRDIEAAANAISEDASADELVLETEVVTYIMALFEDDAEAEALAEGILDGWEKDELLGLFDGDVARYETMRKRFRRKINSHPELKSMIHGE